MSRHGFALLALAIIAIAGWAYNVNYNTLTRLDRVSDLRGAIAAEREAIQVLKVEWAYLNAPERLAQLVRTHNDTLGLEPVRPEALQHVAAVPFSDGEALPLATLQRGGIPIPAARPAGWVPE